MAQISKSHGKLMAMIEFNTALDARKSPGLRVKPSKFLWVDWLYPSSPGLANALETHIPSWVMGRMRESNTQI